MDFAEKVRWRMEHDHNPLFIALQDKLEVKKYAASKGVTFGKVIYETTTLQNLPFDTLPNDYFLKATHGCGWNVVCVNSRLYLFQQGKDLFDSTGTFCQQIADEKFRITRGECIQLATTWMNKVYSKTEWAYQYIRPRIFIEEFLSPRVPGALYDYRFYTFHGQVMAINVGSPSYRREKENVFFDRDWNPFCLTKYREKLPAPLPERPGNLLEMIKVASALGEGIDFVRVDLYDSTKGILLGEMTIYPEGGGVDSPTTCPIFNNWLGSHWKLPSLGLQSNYL